MQNGAIPIDGGVFCSLGLSLKSGVRLASMLVLGQLAFLVFISETPEMRLWYIPYPLPWNVKSGSGIRECSLFITAREPIKYKSSFNLRSAVPENVSTTSEMTSAKAPTSCADKKGGNKTSRNKCSSRKDSGIKQKRVRRKHDETGDSSQTTTVGDSSTPTATLDCSTPTATLKSPRTARRRQEGAKTTSDITFSGTSVTFELTDTPRFVN